VCVCHTPVFCIKTAKRIQLVYGADASPIYRILCTLIHSKNIGYLVHSLWDFPQILDLEKNFARARSSSPSAITKRGTGTERTDVNVMGHLLQGSGFVPWSTRHMATRRHKSQVADQTTPMHTHYSDDRRIFTQTFMGFHVVCVKCTLL